MVEKIIFQITVLCGVVVSEWVEITRVGPTKNRENVVVPDPTYEITLGQPHFYDTTTQSALTQESIKNDKIPNKDKDDYYEETLERSDVSVEDDSTEEYLSKDDEYEDDEPPVQPINTSNNASMMSIFRHIQDQLLDFKGRTFDAKVDHLKKLRDTILYEIKHRIAKLFKPLDQSSFRTLHKDDEHHIDYPSHEGALMTIGFLTFAVFLIKLVLKLIYTLKQQTFQTTTTTTPVSIFLRNERGLPEDETARILKSIEEYPLK